MSNSQKVNQVLETIQELVLSGMDQKSAFRKVVLQRRLTKSELLEILSVLNGQTDLST